MLLGGFTEDSDKMKCEILTDDDLAELEKAISERLENGYFLSHFIEGKKEYIAVLVKK